MQKSDEVPSVDLPWKRKTVSEGESHHHMVVFRPLLGTCQSEGGCREWQLEALMVVSGLKPV